MAQIKPDILDLNSNRKLCAYLLMTINFKKPNLIIYIYK